MIKISLGYYRNLRDGSQIQIPYWFTRDNKVFLNKLTPSVELDETTLTKDQLIEIHNGITRRDLQTNDFDIILESIQKAKPAPVVPQSFIQEPINTAEDLKKKKEEEALKALNLKVEKLLANNFNETKKIVGTAELNENKSLKEGIADLKLLQLAIEKESEKGDDARTSIIKLFEKRIGAIGKSSGFMQVDDEEIEVNAEEVVA